MSRKIYDLLKNHDCILTESWKWRKPSEVVFVDDKIRKLFSSQDIYKLIGKEYISNTVAKEVDNYILKQLGVYDCSSKDLLTCLSDTQFLSTKPDNWLGELYSYLYSQKQNNNISVNDLKNIKIIRSDDNKMTSVSEGDIFLYIAKKDDTEKTCTAKNVIPNPSTPPSTLFYHPCNLVIRINP